MNLLDWLLRDRHTGEVVLGQPPNPPILVFTVSSVVGWLFPDDAAGTWAKALAAGSLTWWALDELLRGVNPSRRLLGAGTLLVLAARLRRG